MNSRLFNDRREENDCYRNSPAATIFDRPTTEKFAMRTARQFKVDGQILVHEFFLNGTMDGPLFPALFSLNMLINNERGRFYGRHEVEKMLAAAGARDIQRLDFQAPNDSYVLCGTV